MTELQQLIEDSKLTDQQIARQLRLPVPTIKRWRSGESAPHAAMLPGILDEIRDLEPQ